MWIWSHYFADYLFKSKMREVIFDQAGAEPRIGETQVPVPNDDQILVKSLWAAMNPIDSMVASYGALVESWPVGLGADASGVVVKAGKVAKEKYGFKEGEHVCGCTRVARREYSTCREYFLMDAQVAMRKPSNLSPAQATTVGAGFQTAALGLFEQGMGIPLPTADQKESANEEFLLVLGGAGSVGRAVVQLAHVCGFEVIASCSDSSSDSVKTIGATATFDYHLPMEDQILAIDQASGGVGINRIFDATSADDPQLAKALFRKVKSEKPKHFVTTNDWSNIGDFEGGKTYKIHLGRLGQSDATEINQAIEKANKTIVDLFEAGVILPQDHEVIGTGGLEDAIKAFKHKAGSKKVVVKIQDE
ncbi:Hypothetical protein R9X50_00511700 [Acrodontium crateriforme]|uniref:Enoyl reductase (ER) domain-containing protein n=1 Tax=Acrodontium crateriforme TaxID=150365 RepID=A0AAQ3M918_9PEZI|nr:Hypothetical protein R9X50_00511700 [Acrodontium crateriforme]